jgi:hypothetical protein
MMAAFSLYRQAHLQAWQGGINWAADGIVITQHTSAYVPSPDTDAFVSALTGEAPSGNGYVQGGITLTGKSAAYVPANAWPEAWTPLAAYQPGQVVRPAFGNGFLFRCVLGGSSGASAPAWPAAAGTPIADGTVTWLCISPGAVVLAASPVQWLSYSGSLRYLVISDRTPPLASQQPLIALCDLGAESTGSGGNFDVTFDPAGVIVLWPG